MGTTVVPTTSTSSDHDVTQEKAEVTAVPSVNVGSSDVTQEKAEVTAVPSVNVGSSDDAMQAIAELKRENARLREMLEDNSLMMDGVLKKQDDRGFTPHYNS